MNLHQAAQAGNLLALLQLIREGADINAADLHSKTPLHCAALYGKMPIVIALITADASINPTDRLDRTPLHLAAERGHTNIVIELIKRGANVNATDEYGNTPLHNAVASGYKDIVLALIENGANVNATANNNGQTPLHTANNGRTPLHLAAKHGHTNIAIELIKKGADINAADQYRFTPLFMAIYRKKTATALAIVHYGKVLYREIPVIENNPTSEYIQHQHMQANNRLGRISSYAKGLFTGMNPSPRGTTMARIKIFVKGTEAKDSYPRTINLLYNGRKLSPDLINVILEYAGLLPKNINLNTLMIYPYPSRRLLPTAATTCTASHTSATSVTTPRPL